MEPLIKSNIAGTRGRRGRKAVVQKPAPQGVQAISLEVESMSQFWWSRRETSLQYREVFICQTYHFHGHVEKAVYARTCLATYKCTSMTTWTNSRRPLELLQLVLLLEFLLLRGGGHDIENPGHAPNAPPKILVPIDI